MSLTFDQFNASSWIEVNIYFTGPKLLNGSVSLFITNVPSNT